MIANTETFHTREISVTTRAFAALPAAMQDHAAAGGRLYQIGRPANGQVLVSTSPDISGSVCAVIDASETVMPESGSRDLSFIGKGTVVWYVIPGCDAMPFRKGTVENVYPDGSVDLLDEYLGNVGSGVSQIFATQDQAESSCAARRGR